MIILKLKRATPVPDHARDTVSAYRWVLDVSWFSVSVWLQYRHVTTGEWLSAGYLYDITINGNWCWGAQHIWYDGPNCNRSFGFVHFNWRSWNCPKCLHEVRSER